MMNEQRWHRLFPESQLGHIGSELARALAWHQKGEVQFRKNAIERTLDLIRLCIDDPLHRGRRKELCRLKEYVSQWYEEIPERSVSLEELEQYCTGTYLASLEQQPAPDKVNDGKENRSTR